MTALVQLGDSRGARFTFEVLRYQYSPSGNRALRYFDLNWLVCRYAASESGVGVKSGSILVFTTELEDLAGWLDTIGGCGGGPRCFGFHDPGLVLQLADSSEEHPRLCILLGDCKGDHASDDIARRIALNLDQETLEMMIKGIRSAIGAFPERREGMNSNAR